MSKYDDGGLPWQFPAPPQGDPVMQGSKGMSLRDWFAGQVISSVKGWHPADKRGRSSAVIAYEIADDMIRVRGNK